MITITPHIEICDKWLEPSIANVSQKQQRKEIWKVANEYIDKTLTFQADARGKEIKRDLLGILQYRSCLIDFFGLPDPKSMSKEAKNQEKTKIKNVEYLFTCIRRGLAERAEEDQTGAYKFLTAADLEEWVEKFNVNPKMLKVFSFPIAENNNGKRAKNVFLSKPLSDVDSKRIWDGLIKYGFIAECSLDDFRWWFNTPFPEKGVNRKPLEWIGNNMYECTYFAKRLTQYVEEDPSDDKTWIGYQIRWKAFITIFPNLKKGKTGTDAIRVNDITKIEASKAKQIDGIIGISAPIRTKEELQKIASKYNPPSKKPEKIL